MKTTLNLVMNHDLADQLLSDPETYEEFKTHCEGVAPSKTLDEFKITDKSGRVIYTSNKD